MSYGNSLTSSVQTHISTVLAQKVLSASTTREIGSTAQEIRSFLTDRSTLSTPDFVIRRYLQANHPGLLAPYGPLPDLVTGKKNVPWSDAVITDLASKLEALSKQQKAAISAAEWAKYLTGSGATKRDKVFRMAFTLKMDTAQTLDLLLAFGMEPYSVRYPLDLICMFCQEQPGTYTWAQAKEMLKEFLDRRTVRTCGTAAATAGMTEQISTDLKALFARNLQGANARDAMVQYMVDHSGEFISFLDRKKEVFLPGYTLNRAAQYRRLTEYLAVLYPYTISARIRKDGEGDDRSWDPKQWLNTREYVVDPDTGKLSLPALNRAMFAASGWSDIAWKDDAPKGGFEERMRQFCENYDQHIDKVNRLFSGGNTIAFFDRRDALLFIFFLISGYSKLLAYDGDDYEAESRIELLQEMADRDDPLDAAISHVLAKIEVLFDNYDEDDAARHFRGLCQCFNMILAQMDHSNLYLPAQFDRFVLLALLSEDPEELAQLVMSEKAWEEYELPYVSPLGAKK